MKTFTCPVCRVESEGSIGPASGCLTPLCPDCRISEDSALDASVARMAQVQIQIVLVELIERTAA